MNSQSVQFLAARLFHESPSFLDESRSRPAREITTISDSWIVSPPVLNCQESQFAVFRATRRNGGNIIRWLVTTGTCVSRYAARGSLPRKKSFLLFLQNFDPPFFYMRAVSVRNEGGLQRSPQGTLQSLKNNPPQKSTHIELKTEEITTTSFLHNLHTSRWFGKLSQLPCQCPPQLNLSRALESTELTRLVRPHSSHTNGSL